jgi:hypothetical protein
VEKHIIQYVIELFTLWEIIIDEILQLLNYGSTGSVVPHQLAECISLVNMVTDMMMIVMEAGMRIGMVMVMGEREKQASGMMTGMADMGTQIVVMEIVMAEIMKNAKAEMVIRMMITVEEVEVLMISSMAQEVGALIETETVLLMMMLNIHHGMCLSVGVIMLLV